MKNMITNAVIVILVIANIFTGIANYRASKPKCLSDNCNCVRVTGSHYCHKHEAFELERKICLEVTSRSSN